MHREDVYCSIVLDSQGLVSARDYVVAKKNEGHVAVE
jgi:hypothetical protein